MKNPFDSVDGSEIQRENPPVIFHEILSTGLPDFFHQRYCLETGSMLVAKMVLTILSKLG